MSTEPESVPARGSVTLQVVLRNARGESPLTASGPVTAGTVHRFAVEPERVEAAVERLRALGFEVAGTGPVLSITASPALVERVFGSKVATEAAGPPALSPPPNVPEPLRDLVAGVLLPPPPELFP